VARAAYPLAKGSDTPAAVTTHGGGSGANVASWLALEGVEVAFVGRRGSDIAGRNRDMELMGYGVDARLVMDPERPTGTCVVLVTHKGDRTMLSDPGANAALLPEDVERCRDLFTQGSHLHLSGYSLINEGSRKAATHALELARQAQMSISVDGGSSSPLKRMGAEPFLEWTQGARLLVVDDNDTCRKVLLQQCSAWGIQASAVPSGKEALALLRTKAHIGEYFDAVLLDQDMPGMTGMQLAARIKEDPSLNHDILLIMLTGISNAPSKIIARNAGIKRILAKPVAGYTLKTTLADELGQRQRGARRPVVPEPVTKPPPQVPADFRVLVAEDNSISTKVIRGMLGKLNLQPDTASNGAEALQAMKAKQYDLVLMDCEMPVLDGFSAAAQLRSWEAEVHRERTPVVALTAHILSEHKERARQAGMDGHMAKPVEMSQLRKLIEFWVNQREARRQSEPS